MGWHSLVKFLHFHRWSKCLMIVKTELLNIHSDSSRLLAITAYQTMSIDLRLDDVITSCQAVISQTIRTVNRKSPDPSNIQYHVYVSNSSHSERRPQHRAACLPSLRSQRLQNGACISQSRRRKQQGRINISSDLSDPQSVVDVFFKV